MEGRNSFAIRHICEWLDWRRRNNQQTILLLGSRAGALSRSLPFYEYCQQYTTHHLQTRARIWSFRECYSVLLQQQLGERELHALLQEAFRHVVGLLGMYEEDEFFAEIVKRGYFREIITTNIDDLVERALIRVGLVEGEDFAVLIPGELPLSRKRALPYRLTKVFGDFLSRKYIIANRHASITEHDEFQQYLRGILHGGVLAIGIDPLWDSGILPLLRDAPTTLWFVNEQEDILHDQQIAPLFDQVQAVAALGQKYRYEDFWRSLYQQLCIEPAIKYKDMYSRHIPLTRDEDQSKPDKKVTHVFYIYDDHDRAIMEKFWRDLQNLRNEHLITEWHRGLLEPGDHLQVKQEQELRKAQLIFIGFSPGFIGSEYYEQAVQALELSHGETVTLVPLLLRPVSNWKQTPFGGIAPLPREGKKTLSELTSKDVDKELTKIADDIHKLVKRLQKGKD